MSGQLSQQPVASETRQKRTRKSDWGEAKGRTAVAGVRRGKPAVISRLTARA